MSARAPGRPCNACEHPQRAEIDRALLAGAACERVAGRFGLSDRGVQRHKAGHLVAQIEAAREARRARVTADAAPEHPVGAAAPTAPTTVTPPPLKLPGLPDRLRIARGAILEVLQGARAGRDPRLVLAAVDRMLNLEGLEARLLGLGAAAVVADQAASAEANEVIATVLAALVDHPEVKAEVAAALLLRAPA